VITEQEPPKPAAAITAEGGLGPSDIAIDRAIALSAGFAEENILARMGNNGRPKELSHIAGLNGDVVTTSLQRVDNLMTFFTNLVVGGRVKRAVL